MQQHGIVAGFGNRQVESRIRRALLCTRDLVSPRITVLQGVECSLEARPIWLGGALGSVVGA
ncbi:hypothetical protein D3C76_1824440 [compost metagenome]